MSQQTVKGVSESLKEMLKTLKSRLDEHGISLRQVAIKANLSANCASDVFSFKSKNEAIINAAMDLIDEAIESEKKIAERMARQTARAANEYYLDQSVMFNQNAQALQILM